MQCEYINEVFSKFFSIGGGQRLAAVRTCAQGLLSAQAEHRKAALQQQQQRGGAPAPSTLAMVQNRLDHFAPNSNRPGAAAGAAAVAAAAAAGASGKENAVRSQRLAGGKRKHSGSESSVNQVGAAWSQRGV